LANKKYISIIRLLKYADIDYNNEINIARVRKQLNAEFDLAANGIIELDGYAYNKSDVFEEIDNPSFQERIKFHKLLWDNPHFLLILEQNQLNIQEVFKVINNFNNNDDFDQFVSPYFATSFNIISRNYLTEKPQLQELAEWLKFDGFMKNEDREEGYKSIRIFLHDNIKVLKNINTQNFKANAPLMIHWIKLGAGKFLSNLPPELHEEKDDIVLYLINICVYIQKTYNDVCIKLSSELTTVSDLPSELTNLIINNHAAYTGSNRTTSRDSGEKQNWGWLIWVAILIIRMLITCNH
jgi:hypothetical protein